MVVSLPCAINASHTTCVTHNVQFCNFRGVRVRSHCANILCSQILRAQWRSLPNAGSVCHRQPFPGQAARSSESVRCPAALASEAIPADDAQYKQPDGGLSQYDKLIVGLAVPALGSILLDPIMSLVDTGTFLPTQFSR